jgi:NADH-quinone oxidoreductase subunit C
MTAMSPLGIAEFGAAILAALPDAELKVETGFDELAITAGRDQLLGLMRYLRDDPGCLFVCLIDICGVDYPSRAERFDVVTHLLSPKHNRRIRVKVSTDEETPVPSIASIYPAANWFEREAYDLFGILFSGHPDLRRILTDYGFEGHPLRKDFPMTGFVEVSWNDLEKRVVNQPVRLTQDFRDWDFLSPWEGMGAAGLPGDEKAVAQPVEQKAKAP